MKLLCRKCELVFDTLDYGGYQDVCPVCFNETLLSLDDVIHLAEEFLNEHYPGDSEVWEECNLSEREETRDD